MLQRIAIPDLTGGVSKQPDSQRFPNQVEEATNVTLHLSKGLEKRPGFEFVKELANLSGDMFVHWIERSSTQKYWVIFRNNATPVHIYKTDGTLCTVTIVDAGAGTYLQTTPENLRVITVDDTTLVVNTSITTALSNSTVTYDQPSGSGHMVDESGNSHNKLSWEQFDLPPSAAHVNTFWYARDDALGHPAGWYKAISDTSQPWYQRVRAPMAYSTFSDSTMPIRIVQTADTTFEVRYCPWAPRYSGDSITNPGPTFVGKKITDVCVHRNRLWFSAGENVCASVAGEFYNFWLNSYATVVDSDPIDVKLGSAQVTKISWMSPFQRMIVVFTESGQQYEIRAAEAMTPSTVSIVPSTTYASPISRPTIVGSQLYWAAAKGPWMQIYEYLTDDSTAQSNAVDIAAHVDSYIPSTAKELKSSVANDLLVVRGGDNNLYVNTMFWNSDKKIQAAWSKITQPSTHTVLGCHIIDDYLYVLARVSAGGDTVLRISRMPIRNSDAYPSYRPRMDCLYSVAGVYDAGTKTTSFTLPFFAPELDTAYMGSEWGNKEGSRFTAISGTYAPGNTVLIFNGYLVDSSPKVMRIGSSFEMNVELSRQYVRDQQGVPAVGTLQLKQCSVFHRNTGYFEFVIDPKTSPASNRTWKYTGKQLGSIGFITNQNVLSDSDMQNFKIMASAGGVDLNIKSTSPAPCNLTNLEFVGEFVASKRSAAST
jgi:hypothetical protein